MTKCHDTTLDRPFCLCYAGETEKDKSVFRVQGGHCQTGAEAYHAGREYIRNTLRLSQHADYNWTGSKPHPTMPRMAVFSYSYKA
jgi:hypothetical protein